uniref:ZNF598/HEL2 C2H2 zinc finger domain-containing protein n=1 Tax=Megaselia scalaris TaxID=36166 RepID=T1GL86_MEGSC
MVGDYNALYKHFKESHFVCDQCTEKFTGIFRSDIDLKAHIAHTHAKNLGKLQEKQARTLQLEITLGPRNSRQMETGVAHVRSRADETGPSTATFLVLPPFVSVFFTVAHSVPVDVDSKKRHRSIIDYLTQNQRLGKNDYLIKEIAVDTLMQKGNIGRSISLYVDSQSAIKALESEIVESKVVFECKESISNLNANNSVRVCWIPGHSEFLGNEE